MDKFYFERECRTRSSECYTVLYSEESIGRLDIHFADNVVHASLNVLNHVTSQQIQELIDAMDEELCEAVGVTKEEIRAIIHVVGIYCGVPQALECFRVARKVLEEDGQL